MSRIPERVGRRGDEFKKIWLGEGAVQRVDDLECVFELFLTPFELQALSKSPGILVGGDEVTNLEREEIANSSISQIFYCLAWSSARYIPLRRFEEG